MSSKTALKKEAGTIKDQRVGIFQSESVRVYRTFFVSTRLTNYCVSGVSSKSELPKGLDAASRKLFGAILELDAVDEVSTSNEFDRLLVKLHPMNFWDEAHDQIVAAIMKRLGWKRKDTDVMSYNDFQEAARLRDRQTVPTDRLG